MRRSFLCSWIVVLGLPAAAVGLRQQEPGQKQEDSADFEKEPEAELKQKACGSTDVKFEVKTDKSQHPTPEVPTDKALVYVVRPTLLGGKVQTKLAIDGEWKGANRGNNYMYFVLTPGEHYFCSKAENTSVLALTLEAGKTYYLEQHVRMGFMKARNKLALSTEEDGVKALAKCHPSVSTMK